MKSTSAVLRWCCWCCFTCWWIFPIVIFESVAASFCITESSTICTIAELNTTENGWARNIVTAIKNKHSWIIVDKAKLPASPGAVASFVQVMSRLAKRLEFRTYHDRVLSISEKCEAEVIDVRDAPELQELQVQPNDHIRQLYIYNASLSYLPQGLRDCPKLENVFAQKNNLTQLSLASFSSIQNLTRVDVSENRISRLTATDQTISIKSLHIENNRLTVVNTAFFERIVNLVYLYLNENQIIRIDNTNTLKMSTLDTLSIATNQLSSFQPFFVEFPVLTSLILSENNLTTIPRNLRNYPLLEILDLRGNKLTRVDLASIRQTKNLRHLQLNKNNIASVSASTPLKHESLRTLYAEENKLGRFNLTGCDFPNIRILNLGANKLTSVPPTVFQQFPSVSLYLWGNTIRCDDLAKYQKQLIDDLLVVDPLWQDKRCLKTGKTLKVNSQLTVCCTEEAN